MKIYKSAATFAAILALLFLCACQRTPLEAPPPPEPARSEAGSVAISFDFNRQSGYASNQYAVWIEDNQGNFITTLYATRHTAAGGYKQRPDSIPLWVERSDLANMTRVDAITGPTPQVISHSYIWDCRGAGGGPVPDGTYRFFVEGSLRWKNRVLFTGEIEVGGDAATVEAKAEYFYEGSVDQPALDASAEENSMIPSVTATYTP